MYRVAVDPRAPSVLYVVYMPNNVLHTTAGKVKAAFPLDANTSSSVMLDVAPLYLSPAQFETYDEASEALRLGYTGFTDHVGNVYGSDDLTYTLVVLLGAAAVEYDTLSANRANSVIIDMPTSAEREPDTINNYVGSWFLYMFIILLVIAVIYFLS